VHVVVSQSAVIRNRLLTSLPPKVLLDLRPKLVSVALALRQPLYNSDTAIEAVYFPESGMISMVANLEDGVQAEVGLIGHEGMLGISLMTGVTLLQGSACWGRGPGRIRGQPLPRSEDLLPCRSR
jgi:CRP-like cAMP-binding protein